MAAIAALHVESLPDTAIAKLGERYAERFYRWLAASPLEHLFVCREREAIVAAAVLSLGNASLNVRLWTRTPLVWHLLARAGRRGTLNIARAVWSGSGGTPNAPEVLWLFTAPTYRRHGLATSLLARVESFLGERGEDRYLVRTAAAPDNPALPFYRARGFTPSARAPGVLVLEKRLA